MWSFRDFHCYQEISHGERAIRFPALQVRRRNFVFRGKGSTWSLNILAYFDGAGAAGAGAGAAGAEAGADAGAIGAGAFGAGCFDVFENCCNTELPAAAAAEFWCMVKAIDVSMNMMAHHVVALERKVAAPRGPNAV